MGWVVNATPRPLNPRERTGTHCVGGRVFSRAGLDGCEKSRPPTGIGSTDRVATPTTISRPTFMEPYITLIIHSAVCLTTGPLPIPKPVLHRLRSIASSFKFQYPLLQVFQELLTPSCNFYPSVYHFYPSVYYFYPLVYHF